MTSEELESVHERLGNERERQEQGCTELSEVRSGHNGWCLCGNCPAMTTEMESVCCKEVPEILQKMGTHGCITDHLSFDVVCLDPEVLQTALVAMRDVHFEDFDVPVRCGLQLIVSSPGGYTHDSVALLGGSFLPVQ